MHTPQPLRVLVVDDEADIRDLCIEVLADEGHDAIGAATGAEARAAFDGEDIDIVITDLMLPDTTGVDLLRWIKDTQPAVDVMLITGHASVPTAVEAMKCGAEDYLTKPFAMEDLVRRVTRVAERRALLTENRLLRRRLDAKKGVGGLIGDSPAMEAVERLILRFGPKPNPVLILGESGTGKELVARAIHANGAAPHEPFIAVDCGALSATLIESELFGHTRGAFTGATAPRTGLLRAAGRGTLFLDEIGELPLDLQAKLLRAIQEREYRPVGSNVIEHFDARIITATNRDLHAESREGRFRQDLYFRLNVLAIHLPPLRERRDDVPLLAGHFLSRSKESGFTHLSSRAMQKLIAHDWPGNVRELQNTIERAMAVGVPPTIEKADLSDGVRHNSPVPECGGTLLHELELNAIRQALVEANGHRLQAARKLGIGKTTLYKKLKELRDAL